VPQPAANGVDVHSASEQMTGGRIYLLHRAKISLGGVEVM